jgi:hypothetical protein
MGAVVEYCAVTGAHLLVPRTTFACVQEDAVVVPSVEVIAERFTLAGSEYMKTLGVVVEGSMPRKVLPP